MPPPRLQLQHYSVTRLLGAAIAVLALVLFGQIPGHGRWAAELGNSTHGPAFAFVTLILLALLRRAPGRNTSILRDYSLAIAGALLLGALIELVQLAIGRDGSFSDLGRDTLGALAATGFFALVDPRVRALPSRRPARLIGLLVGVASTLILVAPLGITGAAYLQRHRSFPTLVDFSSPLNTYFLGVYSAVTVEREALPNTLIRGREGSIGLHARLAGNKGWGIALWEPYPDWRGYQRPGFRSRESDRPPAAVAGACARSQPGQRQAERLPGKDRDRAALPCDPRDCAAKLYGSRRPRIR